jgi:gliding motility-associated-like protein
MPYRSTLNIKKGLLIAIFTCCSIISFAGHIAGGEIYYRYLGPGTATNTNKYEITLRLFRECNPPPGGQPIAAMPTSVVLGIFNNTATATAVNNNITVPRSSSQSLNMTTPNSCITNPPEVCYEVASFALTIDLPITPDGYIVAFQTCCRTNNIANLSGGSQGATYIGTLPGTTVLGTKTNSSPVFGLKDTTLVCRNSPITLDFGATDPDTGDSLVYTFCNAYNGEDKTDSSPLPPTNPPYGTVNYQLPYNGSQPLGTGVSINSQTGLISGIAPDVPGRYVITVCVSEYKSGTLVSVHRKDFTLKIGDCTYSQATLKPSYITCDGFSFTFQNESPSPGIASYAWNFGNPASGTNNTSSSPNPSHTFTDTGKFVVKLKVTSTGGCQDSTQTLMSVYPSFKTDFNFNGNCYQSPFNFADNTTSTYGTINTWRWNFDMTGTNDTSLIKNPSYLYAGAGLKTVRLISTNDKGCIDTAIKQITVRENPVLNLPFKDTLICDPDYLPLIAQGTGNFSWISSPLDTSLKTPNIPNPVVSPNDTTLYIVTLNDNGCIKKDTITVNVLPFITVQLGADTGICRTDTMIMRTNSHALSYQWFPATGLSSTTVKFPVASPDTTTRYFVTANLGQCQDTASVLIKVAPYPIADAGNGNTICYGEKVQLHASYVGTGYAWSPTNTLQNPNSLNPFAGPQQTTAYIFTAFSQGTCPKPKSDTVLVTVRPKVNAFAGNDTTVTAMQPLQLNATGATTYSWTPSLGLSANNIQNPVAILPATVDSIIYKVRATDSAGCYGDDDIKVIVFKTGPDIFIPTGFTPNGDGKNEIAKPVLVGMKELSYFRIYNRWGQMVYSTSEVGKGWDGTLGGKPQPSGTYVFAAQAVDYTGKTVFKKGTLVLIR